MAIELHQRLRGPDGYDLVQGVLDQLRSCGASPTLTNLELWSQAAAEPDGAVALELARLAASGAPITDSVSEELAARFLTRRGLDEEIRSAGDQLTRKLSEMTRAIGEAQRSNSAYGQVLAAAGGALEPDTRSQTFENLVRTLTEATRHVQTGSETLAQKLSAASREIEQLNASLHVVRREALTDALTELANRKAFDERLADAVRTATERGGALALAMVDIDHFKRFNDTWGHQTGDQVIRYVGTALTRGGASSRLVARYGGEEFGVIMPETNVDEAFSIVDDLRREIGARGLKRRSTGDELGVVTVSAGVAAFRRGDSVASLIERADLALYASKRGGRDRVTNADRLKATG